MGYRLVSIKYHKLAINSCQKQAFSPCPVVNTDALGHGSPGHGEDVQGLFQVPSCAAEPLGWRTALGVVGAPLKMALKNPEPDDNALGPCRWPHQPGAGGQ